MSIHTVDGTPITPPSEPPAKPHTPDGVTGGSSGASTPSAVRQHEIDMTLLLTKINQELPDALTALQKAKDHVRNLKLEKAGAERLLAAHRRLREPVRRKK
jgi:hypothetical protein